MLAHGLACPLPGGLLASRPQPYDVEWGARKENMLEQNIGFLDIFLRKNSEPAAPSRLLTSVPSMYNLYMRLQ